MLLKNEFFTPFLKKIGKPKKICLLSLLIIACWGSSRLAPTHQFLTKTPLTCRSNQAGINLFTFPILNHFFLILSERLQETFILHIFLYKYKSTYFRTLLADCQHRLSVWLGLVEESRQDTLSLSLWTVVFLVLPTVSVLIKNC